MKRNHALIIVSTVLSIMALFATGCVSSQAAQTAAAADESTPTPKPTPTSEPAKVSEATSEPTAGATDVPTPTPKAKPTTPPKVKGSVWLSPEEKTVTVGEQFKMEIRLHTGDRKIAAYGINIIYDPKVVGIDIAKGSNGVEVGASGFVSAVNANEPGKLVIGGFDANGVNPGKDINFLVVHWVAKSAGTTELTIAVRDLLDSNSQKIADPSPAGASITVK